MELTVPYYLNREKLKKDEKWVPLSVTEVADPASLTDNNPHTTQHPKTVNNKNITNKIKKNVNIYTRNIVK